MPWLSKIAGTVAHEYRRVTGEPAAGDEEWAAALDAPQGNGSRRAPGGSTPLSPNGHQSGGLTLKRVSRAEWERLQAAHSNRAD